MVQVALSKLFIYNFNAFDTFNVITDCATKFGCYKVWEIYAPLIVQAGTFGAYYTVVGKGSKVTENSNGEVVDMSDPMLGFQLSWEGNPSGAKNIKKSLMIFELDCS